MRGPGLTTLIADTSTCYMSLVTIFTLTVSVLQLDHKLNYVSLRKLMVIHIFVDFIFIGQIIIEYFTLGLLLAVEPCHVGQLQEDQQLSTVRRALLALINGAIALGRSDWHGPSAVVVHMALSVLTRY